MSTTAPPLQTPTCIAVIGAGHVGGPTAVMIAHKCPNLRVLVTDASARKLAAWQSDTPPVYEPGLKEVLQIVRGQNLFFVADLASCVRQAQLIFVAVTTPLKSDGVGAGMAPDVKYWESVARQIGAVADEPKVVIERSTVPVRTARIMARLLRPPTSKVRHEVLSNPSFFASGTALVDLASPDVVLIGGEKTPSGQAAVAALTSVYAQVGCARHAARTPLAPAHAVSRLPRARLPSLARRSGCRCTRSSRRASGRPSWPS